MTAYPYETTKQAGWPKSYYIGDKNNFGPRFGFAYRPFQRQQDRGPRRVGRLLQLHPGLHRGAREHLQSALALRRQLQFAAAGQADRALSARPDVLQSVPDHRAGGPAGESLVYMADRNLLNTSCSSGISRWSSS